MKQCMDADNLHRRLKKIIGQVQAIDRMVDEDVPCEDILSQINAAKSALNGCGKVVLEGHIQHCVRDGIQHGDADKTIESFTKAVERFANMQQPLHASEKSAVWADFFLYTKKSTARMLLKHPGRWFMKQFKAPRRRHGPHPSGGWTLLRRGG